MVEIALDKTNHRKQDPGVRTRNDTYNNLKRLWEGGYISDKCFLEAVIFIYKIIVHKTHFELHIKKGTNQSI